MHVDDGRFLVRVMLGKLADGAKMTIDWLVNVPRRDLAAGLTAITVAWNASFMALDMEEAESTEVQGGLAQNAGESRENSPYV